MGGRKRLPDYLAAALESNSPILTPESRSLGASDASGIIALRIPKSLHLGIKQKTLH